MKVEHTMMPVTALSHCPWNPLGEITPESVADLTASIREKGLLQDIGVMAVPGAEDEGRFWVIYGNRRYVACQGAGMEFVPCKLYSDLTETDAREITRIENEVRLGVDPLRDAELIHSFIAAGRTYEDVALMFGTSPATVRRREKLVALAEQIRKIVSEHPGLITMAALERMSAYPADVQARAADTVKAYTSYGSVGWNLLARTFDWLTRDLDTAPFVKVGHALKCVGCPRRTGCQQNLFGELEGDGKLGRCLDAACFERMIDECIGEELARLVPAGVERVKADYDFQISGDAFGDKRTKDRPACWYYVRRWECKVLTAWGPSKAALDAQRAAEAHEMI